MDRIACEIPFGFNIFTCIVNNHGICAFIRILHKSFEIFLFYFEKKELHNGCFILFDEAVDIFYSLNYYLLAILSLCMLAHYIAKHLLIIL